MNTTILLMNLRDILSHYRLPFDRGQLATEIDQQSGQNLLCVVQSPGNSPTGSLVVTLLDECSFGSVSSATNNRFPRFFSEATHLFTAERNGKKISYLPVLYFNPIDPDHLNAAINLNSRLLVVRGGVGFDWTDIALHSQLSTIQNFLTLGPFFILTSCLRRGHAISLAKRENAKEKRPSDSPKQPYREFKYGYDVIFTIHSAGDESTWPDLRETLRKDIASRCTSDSNPNWMAETTLAIHVLGQCPAIWKYNPQVAFELHSPVFNFQSAAFTTNYCFPHALRGDRKMVTVHTITGTQSTDPQLVGSYEDAPTTEDFLDSLQQQHANLADFAMVYSIYPTTKFTPSRCAYGNPELPNNKRHRYVIIWKDGIQRLLPQTLRTTHRTFSLATTEEPTGQLPGFWTTEHANTHALYYNGLLDNLYSTHVKHSIHDPTIRDPLDLRGLLPSTRWYTYKANIPTQTAATGLSSTTTRQPRGGNGRTLSRPGGGSTTKPGRGHSAHPTSPSFGTYASATGGTTAPSPSTELAIPQILAQILAGIDGQRNESQVITARMERDRQAQTQINSDVHDALARITASLSALQTIARK